MYGMSRGPLPRRALAEALPLARHRGMIQVASHGPENLYDFSIVSVIPVTFVRVGFCADIHMHAAEIAQKFKEKLTRLNMILMHEVISRELWLRSRYGAWRFFRLIGDNLIELGPDGNYLPEKTSQT